jgi:hypothetical protein
MSQAVVSRTRAHFCAFHTLISLEKLLRFKAAADLPLAVKTIGKGSGHSTWFLPCQPLG